MDGQSTVPVSVKLFPFVWRLWDDPSRPYSTSKLVLLPCAARHRILMVDSVWELTPGGSGVEGLVVKDRVDQSWLSSTRVSTFSEIEADTLHTALTWKCHNNQHVSKVILLDIFIPEQSNFVQAPSRPNGWNKQLLLLGCPISFHPLSSRTW